MLVFSSSKQYPSYYEFCLYTSIQSPISIWKFCIFKIALVYVHTNDFV